MSNPSVTIPQLRQIVEIALAAPVFQPIGLLSSPGVGKTMFFQNDFVELLANHHGIQADDVGVIIEKIGQREDASCITGITIPSKNADGELVGTTAIPSLIERVRATGKQYGVIILDEFPQAPSDVQAACSDLLNPEERKVGDHALPEGWAVVFTGNRAQDKSGAKRVLSHLRNGRALLFDLAFDIREWSTWALANDVNPIIIDAANAYHGDGFFADCVPTEDEAYCTPRSLVRAADHLTAYMDSDYFDGVGIGEFCLNMMTANIGSSASGLVMRYIAMADKVPTALEIYDAPHDANVPDEMGFQLLAANRAINGAYNATTGEAALAYITRLRPDLQVSLGTKLLRLSARRNWMLASDEATAFIAKFSDLLPLADAAGWS
jgi:hypothetical protein